MYPTCKELAKIVRKHKGKVEMPVLAPGGLYYLFVEKKDLLRQLDAMPDIQVWYVVDEKDGVLTLCDISESEVDQKWLQDLQDELENA